MFSWNAGSEITDQLFVRAKDEAEAIEMWKWYFDGGAPMRVCHIPDEPTRGIIEVDIWDV
jgi:hypothetical protein